jgi:hypothetical protein
VADRSPGTALEDRLAVESLLDRYPFLVDQGRYGELSGLFAPDGVMEGPVGDPGVGRPGIEAFFRSAASRVVEGPLPKVMRHHVTSRAIELEADSGSARSYFLAMTEVGPDHWGRYRDVFVRVDGEWLIGRRSLSVDGFTPGSWWERNLAGATR